MNLKLSLKWLCCLVTALFLLGNMSCTDLIKTDMDTDPTETGNQKLLHLKIDAPQRPSRLISISEYQVKELIIVVTGPNQEVILRENWTPSMGSTTYKIPVQQLGNHNISVTHVSNENGQTINAEESAVANIRAGIITVIDIIPGAVGIINVDASERAAITKVRELIPTLIEQAKVSRYMVTRMDTIVQAGTLIAEDAPEGTEDVTSFEVDEESYFYFVDLAPGAFYEHPVQYVVVNKKGETKTYEGKWWPKVGDTTPKVFIADVPEITSIIDRNVTIVKQDVTVKKWVLLHPGIIQLLRTEAFIVVQGITPYENLQSCGITSYQNVYNFFNAYRNSSFSTIVGLPYSTSDTVLTKIDDLAADGYDIITIYIIAHGGVDSISLDGYSFFASQFASTMGAHPDIEFNFLLGSCHSGSFVNNLSALDNVRVVKTSTDTALSAWPDWDHHDGLDDFNIPDTGSEWTSSILEAADTIVNDPTLWSIIQSHASTYGVPKTSVLLNEAGYLGLGLNRGLGVPLYNFDLSMRTGDALPLHYCSWEIIY